MDVGKIRGIWTNIGKYGQVWIGQTDQAGMGDMSGVTCLVGGYGFACRSRNGCGCLWASLGI